MRRDELLGRLLRSREPSIRWKTRYGVLGEDPGSRSMRRLRAAIVRAARTRRLLREPRRPGHGGDPWGVYHKWTGVHWALASLADLGYPPGDPALEPMVERTTQFWLRPSYFREFDAESARVAHSRLDAVPRMNGRYRRCASQQGNALFAATELGLGGEACNRLVERLLHWQWPDGGWNCDRNPTADSSSFEESLTPMKGLHSYGMIRHDPSALNAARRASELFLRRGLFRRVSDGGVMDGSFLTLHYPLYYHYDVLGGLKTLARMGRATDRRCSEALDWLESKELEGGGWPAGRRFYDRPGETPRRGTDRVVWGGTGRTWNEWVTVDALTVLAAAGRYAPSLRS